MKYPIIYVCYGEVSYLANVINHSLRLNNDVILLTDNPGTTNVKHNRLKIYDAGDYTSDRLKEFNEAYFHFSTNQEAFEKFCFQRWFILEEFIKKEGIKQFFFSDIDVLLFSNIEKESKKFQNFRMTLTHNISAGISFVNDSNVIGEYCDLCLDIFNREDNFYFDKCYSHFSCLQQNSRLGGVCDMTVWGFYRTDSFNNPGLIGETSVVDFECSTYDHNINQSDGFKMRAGIKDFSLREGIPYCFNDFLNREIKFNCIHFQGAAKRYIGRFLTR